jgi:glyoxylase-like metal-dependent hydrolase (beta-lactamase superfamily II)
MTQPAARLPTGSAPLGWNPTRRIPQLIRVTANVYVALNYSISNVIFVITDRSVVVVDSSESLATARAALAEFRKLCDLPVSYIIYTHFHGDHIGGAQVFHGPGTRVIAQKLLPLELETMIALVAYRSRAEAVQFGANLQTADRGVSLARYARQQITLDAAFWSDASRYDPRGYIAPDITFDDEYRFSEGGVDFELYHTQGETVDHLMVRLPGEGAVFPGDLFYASFPMLSSPMKPDRPVLAWAQSLERMRAMRPRFLVPSHGKPVEGVDAIDAVLTNYAQAIRFVHDETVKGINEGLPVEEIRRNVRLPDDLAKLPYLHQRYGKLTWAVNGIFRQYTGWYDLNPSTLRRNPRGLLERNVLGACGGPGPLNEQARAASRAGRHQLVLELTDIVLGAQPENQAAVRLRVASLRKLGLAATNSVERNLYLGAAASLAPLLPGDGAGATA